jgi:hypothetical protein
MSDDLMRFEITDAGIALMRNRAGYPNPTIRSGTRQLAWWTTTTPDAIRHFVNGYGDDNPLFCDPDYAATTRWGGLIGPPGFQAAGGPHANRVYPDPPYGDAEEVAEGQEEEAWLRRLGRRIPEDFHRETRTALRGIQLFNSGGDTYYYEPFRIGDFIDGTAGGVYRVEDKESEFSGRSAIVTNRTVSWNQRGEAMSMGNSWFVHSARKKVSGQNKYAKDEPARYDDEYLERIDNAYKEEYRRGSDTLYFEDIEEGAALPTMVKGPMTITDEISHYMGWGWGPYGNGALKLGYQNRMAMPGFYSRNSFNSWDVIQRVHWDPDIAREVGVPLMYDIGPMRHAWSVHYCTNFMGDDAWLAHLHTEWRRFNYVGDTTWWNGSVTKKYVDENMGPAIDIEFTGTSQRDKVNSYCQATILLASRQHGPVKLPKPPADVQDRVAELHVSQAARRRASV